MPTRISAGVGYRLCFLSLLLLWSLLSVKLKIFLILICLIFSEHDDYGCLISKLTLRKKLWPAYASSINSYAFCLAIFSLLQTKSKEQHETCTIHPAITEILVKCTHILIPESHDVLISAMLITTLRKYRTMSISVLQCSLPWGAFIPAILWELAIKPKPIWEPEDWLTNEDSFVLEMEHLIRWVNFDTFAHSNFFGDYTNTITL